MKLVAPFETSMERTEARRIVLVQTNVDGVTGWGECVAGESPYYSPETADTAWLILRDYLWPMIKGKEFASAGEVWDLLARVRGHNMAKAALEAAVWDAEAKQEKVPLSKLIGGVREEIACGVSVGIKESPDELAAAVQKELAAGYQRIKIKIKPGKDLELVRRLRQDFPRIKLMVDANSAYALKDWPLFKQLEGFYLMMIEQPLGWDDLYSHIELQKKLDTPICLDECVHTEEQAAAQFHTPRRRDRQQALLGRRHYRSRSHRVAEGYDSRAGRTGHRIRTAAGPHRQTYRTQRTPGLNVESRNLQRTSARPYCPHGIHRFGRSHLGD